MATKSDNKISQAKKEVFRTREKVLEKIGKAKGTNDAEFQALWKRAEDHFELLDNIKKYMENYIRSLTAMCMMEVKLSDDVALSFDPKHGMYECSLRNKDTIGLLDLARSEYDRVIKDDFLGVLADYLRQAGTLKRRKNERDRRKVAQQNKRKYGGMKAGYEALNNEMCCDIPLFINDKDAFFQPLLARFIQANIQFHQRAYELYADLLPHFQHIDRLAIHEHPPVITSEEQTCSNEPIDMSRPVDKAELQAHRSSYRGGGVAAPSSTGYMSAMGGGGAPAVPPSMHTRTTSHLVAQQTGQGGHNNNNNNYNNGGYQQHPQPAYQPPPGNGAPQYNNPHQQPQPPYQPPPPQNNYPPQQYAPPPQQYAPPPQQYAPPPQQYAPPPQQNNNAAPQFQLPPQGAQPGAVKQPAKGPGPKKGAKKGPGPKKGGGALPPGPGAPGGGGGGGGGARPLPGGPGSVRPPAGGQFVGQCRALYPFTGQDSTELNFAAGDVIQLTRAEPGSEWWEGELNGVRGLLPCNYVQRM